MVERNKLHTNILQLSKKLFMITVSPKFNRIQTQGQCQVQIGMKVIIEGEVNVEVEWESN